MFENLEGCLCLCVCVCGADALLQDEGSREANFAIKERYGIDILAESEFYFHYSKNLNLVTTAEMINPAFERHKPLKVRHNTFRRASGSAHYTRGENLPSGVVIRVLLSLAAELC